MCSPVGFSSNDKVAVFSGEGTKNVQSTSEKIRNLMGRIAIIAAKVLYSVGGLVGFGAIIFSFVHASPVAFAVGTVLFSAAILSGIALSILGLFRIGTIIH